MFSPVASMHGNLYNLANFPGYRRYFISLVREVWLGG